MIDISQLTDEEQRFLSWYTRRYGPHTAQLGYTLKVAMRSRFWQPTNLLVERGWMAKDKRRGKNLGYRVFFFVGEGLRYVSYVQSMWERSDADRAIPEPTTLRPGTKAKIELMRQRAAMGMEIHNEADARVLPRRWYWWEID